MHFTAHTAAAAAIDCDDKIDDEQKRPFAKSSSMNNNEYEWEKETNWCSGRTLSIDLVVSYQSYGILRLFISAHGDKQQTSKQTNK